MNKLSGIIAGVFAVWAVAVSSAFAGGGGGIWVTSVVLTEVVHASGYQCNGRAGDTADVYEIDECRHPTLGDLQIKIFTDGQDHEIAVQVGNQTIAQVTGLFEASGFECSLSSKRAECSNSQYRVDLERKGVIRKFIDVRVTLN